MDDDDYDGGGIDMVKMHDDIDDDYDGGGIDMVRITMMILQ